MREPLVISCYFGDLDTGIWPAPNLRAECVFYSNNLNLGRRAQQFGWNFKLIDVPISSDLLISSLQSKYVKFMQMIDCQFAENRNVVYTDHKNLITDDILDQFLHQEFNGLLIRNSPLPKTDIKEEIAIARLQNRYQFAMNETEDWVQNQVLTGRYHFEQRIMNTGLFAVNKFRTLKPLFDTCYRTCWNLAQPECQIIFGVLQQPYEQITKRLNYDDIDIYNEWPSRYG